MRITNGYKAIAFLFSKIIYGHVNYSPATLILSNEFNSGEYCARSLETDNLPRKTSIIAAPELRNKSKQLTDLERI